MTTGPDRNSRRAKMLQERLHAFLGDPIPKTGIESVGELGPNQHVQRVAKADLFGGQSSMQERDFSTSRPAKLDYARRLIRIAVREVVETIRKRQWRAYLVGGTLRDLMMVSPRSARLGIVPRDIDIVVAGIGLSELERTFNSVVQRRTRFGGLHLVQRIARSCEVHYDVWPLEDTWAFRQLGTPPEIDKFPLTPFLNVDAAAVELQPVKEPGVYEHGFYDGIRHRLLDINFEPNPFSNVCAVRALITAAKLRFSLTARLGQFILMTASGAGSTAFEEAQLSHYGKVRCHVEEIREWLVGIERQLRSGVATVTIEVSHARQLELAFDHPILNTDSQYEAVVPREDLVHA